MEIREGSALRSALRVFTDNGSGYGRSIGKAGLFQNVMHVVFDRREGDEEFGADLFVAQSAGYEFSHFQFAAGEIFQTFGRSVRRWHP